MCAVRCSPAPSVNSVPQNGHEVILTCLLLLLSFRYLIVIVVESRLLVGRRTVDGLVACLPLCRKTGMSFGGVGCRLFSFVLPAVVGFDVCRHAVFDCLQLISLFFYPVV